MTAARRIFAALALLLVCGVVDLLALVWMAVALAAGSPRGWRLAIAQDQLANAIAGGDEDEVISSRAWRHQAHQPWRALRPAIDWIAAELGDPNHCETAANNEAVKAATRAGWRFRG
jgi:hypothetical protein